MRIERAEHVDIQNIIKLNTQIHVDTPLFQGSSPLWVDEQVKSGTYFVMRDKNHVCGALCLVEKEGKFQLETIAVEKSEQGKGIGKKFIDFALARAKEKGFSSLVVDTYCEYKVDSFYEHCGFRKTPTFAKYRGKPYHRFTINLAG